MTLVLKPIHLVVVAFLLGALLAGGAALALSGGSDGGPSDTAVAQPTATGVDEAPTPAPASEPTAVPPTTAPAAPAPEPIIRSCAEIRAAGDYLNPEERAFFLAECTSAPAAPAPSASGPAPTTAPAAANQGGGLAEAERAYRAKAEAQMVAYSYAFYQFGSSFQGDLDDILEIASITRNWANQLVNFEPAPPRFKAAHDQLKGALFAYSDQMMKINSVQTDAQFNAWAAGAETVADRLVAAINDYELVVGIDLG